MSTRQVATEEALAVHAAAVRMFGGAAGTRDARVLESALAQPFQTFGGVDLYPSIVEKAARLCFGVVADHPFADGNKRTGAALLGAFLRANGVAFAPAHRDFLDVVMRLAAGSMGYDELLTWLEGEIGA